MQVKCEKCGKEYELNKDDERMRDASVKMAGNRLIKPLINSIAPGFQETIIRTKKYCNQCYHEELDFYTEAIKGALGQKKKEG